MVAWRRPAFSHCTVSYFTLKWSYSFSLYSSIFFSYSLTTMRKWKTWKWVFKRAQKRIHQQNASQLHLLNEFFSYLTNTIIVKSRLFLFLLSSHSSVLALAAKSVFLQLHTSLVRKLIPRSEILNEWNAVLNDRDKCKALIQTVCKVHSQKRKADYEKQRQKRHKC